MRLLELQVGLLLFWKYSRVLDGDGGVVGEEAEQVAVPLREAAVAAVDEDGADDAVVETSRFGEDSGVVVRSRKSGNGIRRGSDRRLTAPPYPPWMTAPATP